MRQHHKIANNIHSVGQSFIYIEKVKVRALNQSLGRLKCHNSSRIKSSSTLVLKLIIRIFSRMGTRAFIIRLMSTKLAKSSFRKEVQCTRFRGTKRLKIGRKMD